MKKFLTFLTLLTLFFTTAWAETVTCTLAAVDPDLSSQTMNGITWDYSITWKSESPGKQSVNGTKGAQIGTGAKPARSVVFSTTGISGTITSVKVNASTASSATATLSVSVGGVTYDTKNLKSSAADYTFTGTKSGEIVVTMNQPSTDKALYLKYIEVTYTTGQVTPTCVKPTIALSPVKDTYYVGDAVTATITCSDPSDATILYRFNNTGNWVTYSSAVAIQSPTEAGTVSIQAKATKTGYNDSEEATASVTFANPPTTFNNLAAVNASDDDTEFTFTAQTVVLGKYNKQLYIVMPDNSAGTLVFGDSNWGNEYTYGKVVSSEWSGVKTTYNDKPEVTDPSNFSLAGTETEVLPIVISSNDDLKKDNFGRYAVINNVQVAADGSFSGLTTYNQFHPDLTDFEAGRYDVYGVIGWNNSVGQFMPIKYVKHEADYTITVNQPAAGGTISASATSADEGEEITLTATLDAGYEFTSWTVKDASNNDVTVADNKFTMPASNVTVTANFTAVKYAVGVNVTPSGAGAVWVLEGCTVENNVSVSTVGTTVKVKLHTNEGYQVDGISVKDADNNEIATTLTNTEADGNTYTFVMPASYVNVTGKFRTYVPKVYYLSGDLSNWDNGTEMTYDSENEVYRLQVTVTDEYGYFRFRANDTPYGANGSGDYWVISENGANESHFGDDIVLKQNSAMRFRVPAGTYDIVIGKLYNNAQYQNTTITVTRFTENTSNQYQLIESTDDLIEGKKYIIVNENNERAYTGVGDGATAITIEDHVTTINPDEVATLTLGIVDGKYTFSFTRNDVTYNVIHTSPTAVKDESLNSSDTEDPSLFSISINNNGIFDVEADGKHLRANGNTDFRFYDANSSGTAIQIYRQTESVVTLPVATPTFSPESGTYTEAQTVSISCATDGATIMYKIGAGEYAEYTEPLTISESTTLSAYATKEGYTDSEVATATYTFSEPVTPGDGEYVKVTSTADLTDGEYLIVYEEGSVAFNGGLETLDAASNTIAVTINNDKIESNATVDAATFTIDVAAGTIKSASGKYIGRNEYKNGLDQSENATVLTNTFSFDNNGNAIITAVESGTDNQCTMRYNKTSGQERFRYFKSGQEPIALYKKVVEEPATEITLAGLVQLGAAANGKKYCINEDLLGVKKSADGKTIWFKDDNKFANPDVCNSTDNNFEMSANGEVWHSKDASFDQSNWIEVVFPEVVNYDENYAKNLTGVYSYNGGNPKLTVTTTDGIEETLYEGTISTNSYMPANFAGSQKGHYTNNGSQVECTYFFVTPKPQEVAKIFYAVYSNGALTMPSNNNGISGTVTVDMSKNSGTGTGLVDGNAYSNFDVIICIDASSAPAPAPQGAPMLKAQGDNYKVYPLNLSSDKVTAISTVGVNSEVKSVKYVSVAGVVSDRPFQGVNIVVTEYTDGSRTTAKVVK